MKTRNTLFLITGGLLGAGLVVGLLFTQAPRLMIEETVSPLSHEETVTAIVDTAKAQGWKIPKTHALHKSMQKFGYQVEPATVVELCQPKHAAKLLQGSDSRLVTSFMPCRVAVYEKDGGEVIVSRMNSGLMSYLFPGEIGTFMGEATAETESILDRVLARRS